MINLLAIVTTSFTAGVCFRADYLYRASALLILAFINVVAVAYTLRGGE